MDEDDDGGLSPDRFYWVVQAVTVFLIALVFLSLSVAAHLMGVREASLEMVRPAELAGSTGR